MRLRELEPFPGVIAVNDVDLDVLRPLLDNQMNGSAHFAPALVNGCTSLLAPKPSQTPQLTSLSQTLGPPKP